MTAALGLQPLLSSNVPLNALIITQKPITVYTPILLGVNVKINRVGDDKNLNFTKEMMTIWCVVATEPHKCY